MKLSFSRARPSVNWAHGDGQLAVDAVDAEALYGRSGQSRSVATET
ncbi:hypothetical protein [Shewanella sp. Actino-trap-3]|nr:hypothetical protein [Shewanella sp. Actino-trap-3]